MSKLIKVIFFFLLGISSQAQELFVFTEPASTMPGNALAFRMMESVMDDRQESRANIHMMPEIMYGISDKLMIHAQGFISNRTGTYKGEGAALYTQYKFLNNDEVQRHFRMAAYGRVAINKSDIHQDEIELVGHNSGFEVGVIATQLLHKVALSSSVSFEQAYNNVKYEFPSTQANNAIDYSLSVGKLMLPKKYTSFKQTNFNLMIEFLGQRLNANGKSYLDIAPSVQFIFLSRARLEIGYRHELYSTMERTAPNGFIFRIDYSFYNVF